jgi:Predicted exonuclease of the beta-lactamase fold involved in RNA processing
LRLLRELEQLEARVELLGLKAAVSKGGAVLLGENFTVDGHYPRPVRVVTHIHSDHILGLERSVRECMLVTGTSYTMDLLEIMGYRVPESRKLPLDYGKPVEILGERVTLIRSRHIVGSAQVEVEGKGYRVGYTGDFKMPGTPPMTGLDVLVVDATYGSPHLQRRWTDWEVMAMLLSLVEESLKEGPVTIYGYNGKIQEIMAELRIRRVKEAFIADPKTIKMARVAERYYGLSLEPLIAGYEAREPAVVFKHTSEFNNRREQGTRILLTGWELRAPVVKVGEKTYKVSFSDHATFKEVIEYVSEAKPKTVIVDPVRGSYASITAKYIERILGIPSSSTVISE